MDKKLARPATAAAKTSLGMEPSKKLKKPQTLTYKDYTIREEKHSFYSKQILTPKTAQQNFLKTTASSRPRTATAQDVHQFKQRVEQKFQNFLQHRESIDDDDSLLQNSQQSRDQNEKKQILKEQQQERRLAGNLKQKLDAEKAQKQKDSIDALNKKVRENIKNQARRERHSKSRERSKERSLQKRTADLVKKHLPDRSESNPGASAQLQDLKSWIEEQLNAENLHDSNLESSEASKDPVGKINKENKSGNATSSLKESEVAKEQPKLKSQKNQLPGNNVLSEKEDAKLGARQDRYGVFKSDKSDFEKVVEIQREKLAPKQPEPKQQSVSQSEQNKGKEHVRDLILQLAKRSGVTTQSQIQPAPSKPTQNPNDDLSEDSCDKVPVRETLKNNISRQILNLKGQEAIQATAMLPGVTNIKQIQENIDKARKRLEVDSTIVIQKFLRGHWGRREAARQLISRKNDIKTEYTRFENEYKNSQNYNLKQYLKDKNKIRSKAGLDSIDEIVENIGESSSTATAHIVKSSILLQNFFQFGQQSTEYDPNSIISIYAKRHSKAPNQEKQSRSTQQKQQKKIVKQTNNQKLAQSNSIIEEDIYSENFDNDIVEEIQKISSSASSTLKQKRSAKPQTLVESDSIADDAPSAALSKSESIADEVGAATKDNSDSESSIKEDSIIQDEFEQDSFKVSNAKKQLEARQRVTYSLNSDKMSDVPENRRRLLLQVEDEKRVGLIKSQNIVGELLGQMREFESANLSQNMMDRMEKIVVSSLAQKDQIIMAQRLAELERENRHKEEINRIREEQIRLMSQLMLLGNVGSSGLVGTSNQKQREDIINSIRSIAENPIIIREQSVVTQSQNTMPTPLSHQQLYQQNKKTKPTYLEENDLSRRPKKFSSGTFSDIQDEKQFKKKQEDLRDDLSDDIVDEVGSVISESIVEEIEDSGSQAPSDNFEEYKNRQYKLAQTSKPLLATYIADIEKAIARKKEQKENLFTSQLHHKKLSPRSYSRKRSDLEDWASRERRDVRDKHSIIQRKMQTEDQKKSEQKSNLKGKLLEDSNDSEKVKQAINQAHLLDQGIIGISADQKYIQRKKEAAERLTQEKEKVIQEQLNSKIRNWEQEMADELLQQALEIDVEKEVQKRFQAARRQLEESQGVESARSAISQSRDSGRQKKNVKFQDSNNQKHESSNNIEESIEESIVDSQSQSLKSSSAFESKSKSLPISPPAKQNIKPVQPVKKQEAPSNLVHIVDQSDSIAEQISDDYTDDFINSENQSEGKHLVESKSKLQNKAIDLAQSAAYSEDFEQESMGQSQSAGGLTPLQIANAKKMDSVLEESIDESGVRSKTSSRMESTNQPQQSEVHSEDQEVQESAQSIDWQIQVPQESARTGQDLNEGSKDSIREDSSMNDRVEMEDFESNPEEIGRSASMSDDIFSKADAIAQDLLDQILREYKSDNSYIVSCEKKQIDEDAFIDKFPYTLDVRVPEPELKPFLSTQSSVKSTASQPVKKQKTTKELQDEIFMKKHQAEQQTLKEQQNRVSEYLKFLVERIDMQEFIQTLDKPIELNPLAVLAQIQAYEDEEPPKLESPAEQMQILPQSFFVRVDTEYQNTQRQNQGLAKSANTQQKEKESLLNVHNYALFEAFNEALDLKRPYKNRGEPMPWSKNTRIVRQETKPEQASAILQEAQQKVIEWSTTGAGSKYAPVPAPPTQTQDEFGEEIVQPLLQDGEEDRRNQQRQEKLGQLMTQDIQETDNMWIDYEIEDTQVRFDLADMILADLASEIAALLK